MKIIFTLALFFACCIFLPTCRHADTSSTSEHLYADYYIRYLAPTQQLKAEARFSEGPDPQTASVKTIKGGVRFLENHMQLDTPPERPPRYTWNGSIDYTPDLYFQYERKTGLQRPEITLLPIHHYTVKKPFILQEGLQLTATGSRLKGNETLTLLLADAENRATSFTIQGPTTDTIHYIPPGAFPEIQAGEATLYLIKRMKKTMGQADQTITATIEYYTDTVRMQIVR